MAYTVLARRYRSTTFDDVIGQDHVARTLKRAIESGRIAHAFLFCGTRGVGKTSMARILAKALNCESSDKPTPNPCGKCNSCVAIARGEDIDVIEIDAASNRGIENVRDIISNAQFRPARSRFKVYIIDEVHGLTKDAFNALLKVLEEPPEHVKFILATTEPEKVLPTILSRCQRYDFRNIPTREIAGHLREITKQENIQADEDALQLIAKAGAGSMRDALSLLDRLLSVGEKKLTADMIEQLLGLPRSQLIFDIVQAIGEGDTKSVLKRADAIINGGFSVDALIAALVDHLRNLLVLKTCGPDPELVEVPGLLIDDLAAQAERFDAVALSQDIAILEELRRHVRQSQAGRALLDATLVRLALSDQFASIGELLSRLDGNAPARRPAGSGVAPKLPVQSPAQAPLQKKKPLEIAEEPSSLSPVLRGEGRGEGPTVRETAESLAPPVSVGNSLDDLQIDDDLPQVGRVWESSGPSLSELLSQSAASSTAAPEEAVAIVEPRSNVAPASTDDLPSVWQKFIETISRHGPGLQSIMTHGRLASVTDDQAVVRYGAQHDALVRMLEKNGKRELVRDAFSEVLNRAVSVSFQIDAESPADSAPAVAAPTRPQARRPATPAPTPEPEPALPATPTIKVTPDLIETIRQSSPLAKSIMDELGAIVVKVEDC